MLQARDWENGKNFLSFKALQGGGVLFDNEKKGYFWGEDMFGKSMEHTI